MKNKSLKTKDELTELSTTTRKIRTVQMKIQLVPFWNILP